MYAIVYLVHLIYHIYVAVPFEMSVILWLCIQYYMGGTLEETSITNLWHCNTYVDTCWTFLWWVAII